MLLMPGPIVACVEAAQADPATAGPARVILLTPGGRPLEQRLVENLAAATRLVLVCGRYEGFDARIAAILGAEEVSIGDYVLSGGEPAAMVVVDAVVRLLPGVLGDEASARDDSFSGAERLVEGPQYTRPREFRGLEVPEVLISGDHGRIARWRHEQAAEATRRRAPPTCGPDGLHLTPTCGPDGPHLTPTCGPDGPHLTSLHPERSTT